MGSVGPLEAPRKPLKAPLRARRRRGRFNVVKQSERTAAMLAPRWAAISSSTRSHVSLFGPPQNPCELPGPHRTQLTFQDPIGPN